MSRNVFLGLHGYSYNSTRQMHDAGVCIIDGNGTVLAAVDEERLSRAKRDGTFPLRSYQSAMNVAGVVPDDIKSVAFVDRRSLWQSYWVWRYAMETYLRTGITPLKYLLWWNRQVLQFNRYPPPELKGKTIKFYEHHRCHGASAVSRHLGTELQTIWVIFPISLLPSSRASLTPPSVSFT